MFNAEFPLVESNSCKALSSATGVMSPSTDPTLSGNGETELLTSTSGDTEIRLSGLLDNRFAGGLTSGSSSTFFLLPPTTSFGLLDLCKRCSLEGLDGRLRR